MGIFRPSQFYPLCSLEIRANADGLLLLGVTDIRVNEPVTAQRRRFPPLNGLPPEVEIKEFQVTGAAEAMGVPARLLDVGRRRRELEEPQWRHGIEAVDWAKASRIDERVRLVLQPFLSPPEGEPVPLDTSRDSSDVKATDAPPSNKAVNRSRRSARS